MNVKEFKQWLERFDDDLILNVPSLNYSNKCVNCKTDYVEFEDKENINWIHDDIFGRNDLVLGSWKSECEESEE